MNLRKIGTWGLRIIPAFILLQTLYFKFSAHPDSVKLFTELGVEPYGRIGLGVVELIASILILWPKFTKWGALVAIAIMLVAIASHLFKLGIEFNNDGGQLFIMACITLVCSIGLYFFVE